MFVVTKNRSCAHSLSCLGFRDYIHAYESFLKSVIGHKQDVKIFEGNTFMSYENTLNPAKNFPNNFLFLCKVWKHKLIWKLNV